MSADFWLKWNRYDIFMLILGNSCPLNPMQLSKYSNSLYFSKYSRFPFFPKKNSEKLLCQLIFDWNETGMTNFYLCLVIQVHWIQWKCRNIRIGSIFRNIWDFLFFPQKNPKNCYFSWIWTEMKQVGHIYINLR